MPKKLTQEEAIAKAVRTHGDKYDLSKLLYTGTKKLVRVGCVKHGWFDIIFRDFTKQKDAGGCQKCAWEDYLAVKERWNKISPEDAEKRLLEKYGDVYTFDMSTYISFSKPMSVYCPHHGVFQQSPSDMVNMSKSCPDCGKLLSASKRTKDIKTRVDEATARFGGKYSYHEAPVKTNNKTEFYITCTKHSNRFITSWNRHLNKGGLGCCVECYKEAMSEVHKQDTEDFIRISVAAHGYRYGYSRSVYVDHKTPVEIECYEHGFFWQRADKHKIGQGCDKCVKNGFRNNKPAHLYVLQDGLRVKVGITNRSVKTRLSEINIGGGKFSLVQSTKYVVGLDCRNHETKLLQYMRSLYKNTEGTFDGVTESFEDVDVSLVLEYVKELNNGTRQ